MRHITSTLLAAALGAALALPAAAQPGPQGGHMPQPQPQMQGQHAPAAQRAPQQMQQPQRAPAAQRTPQQPPQQAHALRQWRQGERLPSDYRHRQYIVNDWRAHNLPRPPRGQHWVQVDGGYARIVIATGIIMQLIGL